MLLLNVHFKEKDNVKALGGRWDNDLKSWYVPDGLDPTVFSKWMKEPGSTNIVAKNKIIAMEKTTEEISLSQLLRKISTHIQKNFSENIWVRAEISDLKNKQDIIYIDLVETDEQKKEIAKTKACIWNNNKNLLKKFFDATGYELSKDIKVLVCVRSSFHVKYGFNLSIEDIDPSFTLGEMLKNLENIRNILIKENIFDKNKRLVPPSEFMRIAVISPEHAAALGDFNREANLLMKYELCKFEYFTAIFQAPSSSGSIQSAFVKIKKLHQEKSYDALVIIRGGGAVTDLAWLNDETIAREICQFPIPVLCGIGHERDKTIIDEISCVSFDTPSKVINHIFQKIMSNADSCFRAFTIVKTKSTAIIRAESQMLKQKIDHIITISKNCLREAEKDIEIFTKNIRFSIKYSFNSAEKSIKAYYETISKNAQKVYSINSSLNQFQKNIQLSAHMVIRNFKEQLTEKLNIVKKISTRQVCDKSYSIEEKYKFIFVQFGNEIEQTRKNLDVDYNFHIREINNNLKTAKMKIEHLFKEIIGQGPEVTLKRGYTLVRNQSNSVVTSKEKVNDLREIKIQFFDGEISVINQTKSEG